MRSFALNGRAGVIARAAALSLVVCAATGCSSDRGQREEAVAQARAALERQAAADRASQQAAMPVESPGAYAPPASDSTAARPTASPAAHKSPAPVAAAPPAADSSKPDPRDIAMPVYPHAHLYRPPGAGSPPVTATSGMTIMLLETSDSPEAVSGFYTKAMSHTVAAVGTATGKLVVPPSQWQSSQNGKPVTTISESLPDGRLHTVEIRSESGKTVMELMDIAPRQSSMPAAVPGGSSPGRGPATHP